jgi:hypothetical protein
MSSERSDSDLADGVAAQHRLDGELRSDERAVAGEVEVVQDRAMNVRMPVDTSRNGVRNMRRRTQL